MSLGPVVARHKESGLDVSFIQKIQEVIGVVDRAIIECQSNHTGCSASCDDSACFCCEHLTMQTAIKFDAKTYHTGHCQAVVEKSLPCCFHEARNWSLCQLHVRYCSTRTWAIQ